MTVRPQTAIAAALHRAGFNTSEARLRQSATDALKKHHRNIPKALDTFERAIEDDPELIREALLYFLCRLDSELAGSIQSVSGTQNPRDAALPSNGAGHTPRGIHPMVARPVREPSPEDRAASARVAQSIAVTIFDRVKTSDGRPWGNVGAHELDGMDRDGAVARIVKNKLGVLSNAQRFQTLRELMRPDLFEEAIAQARGEIDAAH